MRWGHKNKIQGKSDASSSSICFICLATKTAIFDNAKILGSNDRFFVSRYPHVWNNKIDSWKSHLGVSFVGVEILTKKLQGFFMK